MQTIFIHGSGADSTFWAPQLACFEDAIAVDLPGHPNGEPCTTVDAYADWLQATLAGHDNVLVGHSLGGAIALICALNNPAQIHGIVLIGSGARLRVHQAFLDGLETGSKSFHAGFLQQLHAHVEPHRAQRLIERSIQIGSGAMLNDLRACNGFDVLERLGDLAIPLLAICGEDDVMTPPKYSQHLANAVPDGRCVVIPDGTHLVAVENPQAVNEQIALFLASPGIRHHRRA